MTPADFIRKWRNVELKERSASQSHFNDLCRLLGVDDPTTADGKGEWFMFEKGATKITGGDGWADVWRKNCFAWEYKGKGKNLDDAFVQLQRYAITRMKCSVKFGKRAVRTEYLLITQKKCGNIRKTANEVLP